MEFQDFKPRPYQEELLKIAIQNNTIIYLPTGSGKTFIAILLIKHLSKSLEKSYLEGGKRSIFLVNTVPLVEQQKSVIENLLPFSVGSYSGDDNVDLWNAEKWKAEIIKNQILVMTSQIFLDMIQHRYFDLNDCNLIIFDECHHAVEDHPMRNIMKQFEFLPREKQPRVVGLTATLLNNNVKIEKIEEEIRNLEITYYGKIATANTMSEVLGFSTNPLESVITFTIDDCVKLNTLEVKKMIHSALCFIEEVKFPKKNISNNLRKNINIIDDQKDMSKKLKNIMFDIQVHVDMLGLYGGLKSATIGIINLIKLKRNNEEPYYFKILSVVETKLLCIQKYIENLIGDKNNIENIFKYSSDKIRTLFDLILKYQKDYENKKAHELMGIIFVQRRTTAQILYHIIKNVKNCEKFSFLKPDFVVGFSNSVYLQYAQIRRSLYLKKCNMSSIRDFNNKLTNILVSSSVMEEGIDIPNCTFITMFDFPMNYRSYIQSKGRARHKDGKYNLMVPQGNDTIKLFNRYRMYKKIEDFLKMFLIGKSERNLPSEADVENQLYDHLIEPYIVESTNAVATMTSSISLVNRYCSNLPQDKFTESAPVWYKEISNNQICVYLEFPMQSLVKEVIKGPYMYNIKDAKRAAALKAVQRLHEFGELNDLLLPKEYACLLNEIEIKSLFTHLPGKKETSPQNIHDELNSSNECIIKPGTKKSRRLYKKKCPDVFYNNILSNKSDEYFLHVIEFESLCEKSNFSFCTRKYIEKITSQHTFAILSKTHLQNICDFSIYFSFGEVNISLKTNYHKIVCDENEIEKIQRFHCFIFSDVLKILKSFLIFDTDGKEYSYFLVPVIFSNTEYNIDYSSLEQKFTLENICEPDLVVKKNLIVTKKDYTDSIVFPWYRESTAGYLVCDVCEDLNSLSEFPTNEYNSFSDYYYKRHGKIIENPTQPLLLVTGISSSLNYLKPRSEMKKKYKLSDSEHMNEHFIPELCIRISFSSDLWLKVRSIPSILHRIEGLYRAKQLYTSVIHELNLFSLKDEWASLKCDPNILNKNYKNKTMSTDFIAPSVAGRISPVVEMLDMKTIEFQGNYSNKIYPWKEEQEPIDIERNIDTVNVLDIEYYENFISQKLYSDDDDNECHSQFIKSNLAITFENIDKEVVAIEIIQNKCNTSGPELKDFYQALVAASANDIINLERYETLGDSFLKFCTSLYLYLKFPNFDEGKLTYIKGQAVGNRNLFYCAKAKELGSFMNVQEFLPEFDVIPPCFCLPHNLMKYSDVLPRSVLYQLKISQDEQFNGLLEKSTIEQITSIISRKDYEISSESMLNSLTSQLISDKCMADCVEALIGCFLNSNGIEAALKLVGWFEILPRSEFLENLLNQLIPSPVVNKEKTMSEVAESIDFHLILPENLEKILGYKFKNRAYILQAFSHASYSTNKITGCYQRLEFLGDAILDFLITCYIYEFCGNLSPGELTDLRSALVNNVVFASLVVKNELHKFLLAMNPQLNSIILKFIKYQEENNFMISENVLFLLEEDDYNLAECVDVPKALGDIFESLAGAIFLDSGMNLEVVWKVFYKLMRPIIEDFSQNVPKNVVRKLYEETKASPKFSPSINLEDGNVMVGVTFLIDGHKKKVYGYGKNKKSAKVAAAKIALKALKVNEIINTHI